MMAETTKQQEIPVSELHVRDIMQRQVATIREIATVRELAELLMQKEVSGAPVVSGTGDVVGVVSLWDIVGLAMKETQRIELLWPAGDEHTGASSFFAVPTPLRPTGKPQWRTIVLPLLERHRVRDIMTRATFQVRPDASIRELAQYFTTSRIHRALVFEDGRLVGIVTTMDIVSAVAGMVP